MPLTAQQLFDWLNTNYPTYASTVQNVGEDVISLIEDQNEAREEMTIRFKLFRIELSELLRRMPEGFRLVKNNGWKIKFDQDPDFNRIQGENLKRFIVRWVEHKQLTIDLS